MSYQSLNLSSYKPMNSPIGWVGALWSALSLLAGLFLAARLFNASAVTVGMTLFFAFNGALGVWALISMASDGLVDPNGKLMQGKPPEAFGLTQADIDSGSIDAAFRDPIDRFHHH